MFYQPFFFNRIEKLGEVPPQYFALFLINIGHFQFNI